MTRRIGITGGIGAGKSVVSRIMRDMGYPVYDTDSEARRLMDNDETIHQQLCKKIHPQAVVGRTIDRRLIADIVFSDKDALGRLNAIVHGAVINDFCEFAEGVGDKASLIFVESAILYECDLYGKIDEVWEVTAPIDVRVARVMARSGLSSDEVMRRIRAQQAAYAHFRHRKPVYEIVNDGLSPLLPRIDSII